MKTDKETLEKRNLIADIKKKSSESENQKALAKQSISDSERMQGQINVNKSEELRLLLASHIIDDDKSIIGSEPFYTSTIKGKNRDIVMKKLIEVVERF